MFGMSTPHFLLLMGVSVAIIGPKELPRVARMLGRLTGRSIAYVQMARGQFDNVMEQSQARQVQKELQDALSQLDSIRYEMRSLMHMNPGPMTRPVDNPHESTPLTNGVNISLEKAKEELKSATSVLKDNVKLTTSESLNFHKHAPSESLKLHAQATGYAKLAESTAAKTGSLDRSTEKESLTDESGLFTILPVSAESAGMLPNRKENVEGSDIVLAAVLEAEIARNAKDFFSRPENQVK